VRVTFHPAAVAEARDARRWYADRDARAAGVFIREFDAALRRLIELPQAWPTFEAGTRRILLKRYPYQIIYREKAGHIEIVAVMHERRRPGYWQDR